MERERLTAFTDGVIAVIITIMVLDLKAPHSVTLGALAGLAPAFLGYVLSFLYVAIYWNNHHHFFQLVPRVTGGILWANMHLLFWLSLTPLASAPCRRIEPSTNGKHRSRGLLFRKRRLSPESTLSGDHGRSKPATSSMCGDQTNWSIGRIPARREAKIR